MKPDIRVNRVFVLVVIAIQAVFVAIILIAVLAPKSVTVHVKKVESSYQIKAPLKIDSPDPNR